ncbi:LytR family transcriptional regulator [Pseudarthrobacter psychrotolerans]|uniref:LytR family transcriptional regulator n=1 Tax=Pseudarthrobacter psychrotolerans TaxID=2697569 RepID=A0A6P1NT01_9MICC|nr:LytR C-terminal domain-containing protein [Pseudarthrobacter psychrotolerans]QHK21480.1 LytR family transcriptional regulator [Pseudarthrobacter psychrotolerans]
MARKPRDARVLHGHHIVTGPELRATFEAAGDPDNPVRVRRRVVHGVVLVLLLGLIAGAIIVALAIMNGHLKLPTTAGSDKPLATCPGATFDYTPNDKINLNVYNSTSRPGLARSVADELLVRKFVVGAVANTEAGFRGVAAVISGAAGQSAAFSVQRNLLGSDYFQDGRTDASVDVILSSDYRELAAADRVDQTPGKLSCPRESRRIADDAKWPVIPTAGP